MINVLIGGDICPVRRNEPFFRAGDAQTLFTDLMVEFENADLALANLECPLIERETPIAKNGPVLGVTSDCIKAIQALRIDVLNLANNHIMDHGPSGLMNTLKVCRAAGFMTVGAGTDLEAACELLITEVKGVRIAVLAMTEHEFSIADLSQPGANPLDCIRFTRIIKHRRPEFDYLIVLVHSGLSNYPLPSPRLRETCRFLAEMGANAVICQHSHCPGCFENYEGSYIVYGQGNFIFDLDGKPDPSWNRGFLVHLQLGGTDKHSIRLIPYEQSNGCVGARRMPASEEAPFLEEVNSRSSRLNDSRFIQEEWLKACEARKDRYYLGLLLGYADNRLVRFLHRRFPFAERFLTRRHSLLLENYLRSESHREAIESILAQRRQKSLGSETNDQARRERS